ncbi:MAG: DUF4328 domain-containing protein [Planctomycetota bacterium]
MTYQDSDPQPVQPDTLEYASGNVGGMGYATFQPNEGRARTAIVLLWINLVLTVIGAIFSVLIGVIVLTDRTQQVGQVLNPDQGAAFWVLVSFGGVVGFAAFAAWVLMIVYYMMWQYRAAGNLGPLGVREQRYTPGWNVGWWFIPFANLVMPFRCMRELETASRTGVGANATKPKSDLANRTQILLLLNIGVGLVGGLIAGIMSDFDENPTTASNTLNVIVEVASGVIGTIYLYLFIRFIKLIQSLQETR